MLDRREHKHDDIRLASKVYWNAINALRDIWFDVYQEDVELGGQGPRAIYQELARKIHSKLQDQKLIAALHAGGIVKENLGDASIVGDSASHPNTDDIAPREFKEIIYECARNRGEPSASIDVAMTVFQRDIYDLLQGQKEWTRKMYAGKNRHWPRTLQWIQEVAGETYWGDDGQGIKIMNQGGGRVAAQPDPRNLKVRICADYL